MTHLLLSHMLLFQLVFILGPFARSGLFPLLVTATHGCRHVNLERQILAQHTMKVDSQLFPQANVVELSDFEPKGRNLAFQINMVGPMRRHDRQKKEAASGKRP